jgi:hypothetical protein
MRSMTEGASQAQRLRRDPLYPFVAPLREEDLGYST